MIPPLCAKVGDFINFLCKQYKMLDKIYKMKDKDAIKEISEIVSEEVLKICHSSDLMKRLESTESMSEEDFWFFIKICTKYKTAPLNLLWSWHKDNRLFCIKCIYHL